MNPPISLPVRSVAGVSKAAVELGAKREGRKKEGGRGEEGGGGGRERKKEKQKVEGESVRWMHGETNSFICLSFAPLNNCRLNP